MLYTLTNNTKISKLCFGCEPLGGYDWGVVDITELEKAILLAVDHGINFFDVADAYGLGLAEERLANILGHRRHNLFIATKGGVRWFKNKKSIRATTQIDNSPEYLEKALINSLKRLKIERVPLYYLHWPENKEYGFLKGLEKLNALKTKGLISFLGVSNFSANQLAKALKAIPIDFIQLPCNILNKPLDCEIQTLCKAHNIHIVAYNVLASGLLTGKYDVYSTFSSNDRRSRLMDFKPENLKKNLDKIKRLKREADKKVLTLAQYSIDSLLNKDAEISHVITGIKSRKQLLDNLSAIR